jgi:peptide deformylase
MEEFVLEADDLLARAICHEFDHLDGHMYVEKVTGGVEGLVSNDELYKDEN